MQHIAVVDKTAPHSSYSLSASAALWSAWQKERSLHLRYRRQAMGRRRTCDLPAIKPAAGTSLRLWLSRRLLVGVGLGAILFKAPLFVPAAAQESTEGLAAAAQNPVAAVYSLPFQNNTYFNAGPNQDKAANVLNIQPVLPFTFGDWNLISRTIAPLIYVPSVRPGGIGSGSLGEDTTAENVGPSGIPETFGLGDINQTFFLSPAAPSAFIWGAGPSFNLPTASEHLLGSGKFSIGPSAVGLVMPKPWVFGMLVRQLFSIAGPSGRTDVNQTLLQPFANYNLPDGWYLTSSPVITANWSADSGQRWSVPIGGGAGKIFRIGPQPINASFQVYDYVERPSGGANWAIRFQVQFLFPR